MLRHGGRTGQLRPRLPQVHRQLLEVPREARLVLQPLRGDDDDLVPLQPCLALAITSRETGAVASFGFQAVRVEGAGRARLLVRWSSDCATIDVNGHALARDASAPAFVIGSPSDQLVEEGRVFRLFVESRGA